MGGGSGNTVQRSSGSLPWWVQSAHQGLVENAEAEAYNTDYTPYEGQRIAGLSDQENAANANRQAMFDRGDVAGQFAGGEFLKGSQALGGIMGVAGSEFTGDEVTRRMNPYIDSVVKSQQRDVDESFDRRLNQSNAQSIARGGSIGSYRVGLENAFIEGERAESLGDIRKEGNLAGYNQALQSFESDRSTKLQGLMGAAQGYQASGIGASQVGTASLGREQALTNELDRSGAIGREIEQREYDLAYKDFAEERDYPKDQMNWLSGILSGVPTQQLGSQTLTAPQPGLASQLIGLGLGATAINKLMAGG